MPQVYIPDVRILGIDSNHDDSTAAPCAYRDRYVYPHLGHRFPVKRLKGEDAERAQAAEQASNLAVRLITGVGHGFADRFTGHWEGSVFQVGDYDEEEVKGKVVHFFACETARELGPDFLSKGCVAFFGYDQKVLYSVTDSARTTIDVLFACDSAIDIQLANWKHPVVVFEEVLEKFDQEVICLGQTDAYLAATLQWSRDHLRLLLGESKRSIVS